MAGDGGNEDVLNRLNERLEDSYIGDVDLPLTQFQQRNQRNLAVFYATLLRVVTLISGVAREMIAGGELTVRDRENNKVDTRRTQAILDLLCETADNGLTDAGTFVEDLAMDYLLDGNGVMVPSRRMDGTPWRLVRYRPYDAHTEYDQNGELFYNMHRADGYITTRETFAARDVIHVRWPRSVRTGLSQNSRDQFAPAPVILLRRQISIGLQSDREVDTWFRGAARSGPHFNLKLPEGVDEPGAQGRKDLQRSVQKDSRKHGATVGIEMSVQNVETTPQSEELKALRELTTQESCRFYGIPLPLVSVEIGQWTRGINEQVLKLAWRTALKNHVMRMVEPIGFRLLRRGQKFHIDPIELVRGDAEGMSRLINSMNGDGQRAPVATREELRRIAGLPVVPEGEFIDPPMSDPDP